MRVWHGCEMLVVGCCSWGEGFGCFKLGMVTVNEGLLCGKMILLIICLAMTASFWLHLKNGKHKEELKSRTVVFSLSRLEHCEMAGCGVPSPVAGGAWKVNTKPH